MPEFSLGDIISGEKKGELTDLFSHKSEKSDPKWDYSVVPKRKRPDEDEEVDLPKKQKKSKLKKKLAEENEESKVNEANENTDTATQPEQSEEIKNETKDKKKKKNKAEKKENDIDEEKVKKPRNLEHEARTVFIGNLPTTMTEKGLSKLFASYGKIEAIRFRSAARPDFNTSKKVAVIKRNFHAERSNINAYIRFSNEEEAKKGCSLNGHKIGENSIRVDMSLKSDEHDQKKAVFLGNLNFKTNEEDVRVAFSDCGEILNIRLVRDSDTGIGKGFGYVNFADAASVETALQLDATEVCGRKIRVSRASRKKPQKLPAKKNVPATNAAPKAKKPRWDQNRKDAAKTDGRRGRGGGAEIPPPHSFTAKTAPTNATFSQKFEAEKKRKFPKAYGKNLASTKKSFQGVSTTEEKGKTKKKTSNAVRKKQFIAKKLLG
eukprot:TRINITY_DN23703_c0_g1_i1.p1 TRINITY_DN23703_c0_g1~~TRINITY_DN23703_c0_g1_i1.p1  ORF type:complete len:434 (+),score=89.64 TRINITY_DN23703_c0_g1_i1:33-1334(+)